MGALWDLTGNVEFRCYEITCCWDANFMRYGASVDILETLSGYDDTHGVKYSNIYI